jgi:hemolysin III
MSTDAAEPPAVLHYPTRAERVADGWVHAVGVAAAAMGAIVLFGLSVWRGGPERAGAVSIYALCLVGTLAISAAYNLADRTRARRLLRRIDHAAIFLMIAGSYTPFTTQRFEGAWAVGMTAAVWIIALLGAAGKVLLPGVSRPFWLPVYVLLGWMVVAAIDPLVRGVSLPALILLIVGGAIYTLGVAIYVWPRLPFRRAIWHGFVLAAAGSHYAAVLTGVVLA